MLSMPHSDPLLLSETIPRIDVIPSDDWRAAQLLQGTYRYSSIVRVYVKDYYIN